MRCFDEERMRILVLGSAGQLGSELARMLADQELVPATRDEVDIIHLAKVVKFVEDLRPEAIINAAAYTDVDSCESNQEKAFLVNAIGARNVAIAARKAGSRLAHISTDYVFDGSQERPYVEHDPPRPLNIYGWSKLLGEEMVKAQNPSSFILRVAWIYSPVGRNFVKTMIALAQEKEEIRVVSDQRGTPTFAGDVARQIKLLLGTESYGLYHSTSQGSCTWYEFAREIFRLLNIAVRVLPVTSGELPRPAKRPANSVLDNFLLRIQGLDIMPPWEESLAANILNIKEAVG
jgi:dTDP-4-dehydrorhamnose reductase